MAEHLVPEYHRARLVVVVCAGLIFLWWVGIPFEGSIPLINVKLPHDARLPYVMACLLGYGLLRLMIEWAQSEPERRRRRASRVDLALTLSIGGAAAWALAPRVLTPIQLPDLPLVSSLALIVLGIVLGELLMKWLLTLFLIRNKEEARRLALPRIPVAVRASFRMGYVVLPTMALVLLLTPALSSPMSSLWPWLVGTPLVLLVLSGAAAFASRRHTKADGTVVTRSEFLKGVRAVFDRHDAHYQIGGWDRPIPPSNSPLYQAAERGDSTRIPQLKSKARPQVTVNPNKFLYHRKDNFHPLQLRRSSKLTS